MFSIHVNKEKNRLYIELGGTDTGDGQRMLQEIETKIVQLEKGFECISDISNFSFNDRNEAVWAEKVLKTLAGAGMARAIRVTGTDVKYRETTEKYGYVVGIAKTVQAAEAVLDQNLS